MCWRYVEIFLSASASLTDRASHAGYVVRFLRVWRASALQSRSASTAFISRETYIDVVLSCHHAVLLMKATRDFTPNQAVHLEQSGSDCCEDFFSANGSFVVNKHVYNFQDLLRNASKMNRLTEITSEKDGLILTKRHKKQENIWMKDRSSQDQQDDRLTILKQHPTDTELVTAWRRGIAEANADLKLLLGMLEHVHKCVIPLFC